MANNTKFEYDRKFNAQGFLVGRDVNNDGKRIVIRRHEEGHYSWAAWYDEIRLAGGSEAYLEDAQAKAEARFDRKPLF